MFHDIKPLPIFRWLKLLLANFVFRVSTEITSSIIEFVFLFTPNFARVQSFKALGPKLPVRKGSCMVAEPAA